MTAQVGDTLIIAGEAHMIAGCPALPWHDPRLVELTRTQVAERFDNAAYNTTACWRGYIARWRLEDGKLYFEGSQGKFVFEGPTPILADWVTEEIRIPQGDMIAYLHMGFGSIHEEDLILQIRMGREVSRHVVDNRTTSLTDEENRRRGIDHLPSVDTVHPGRFGNSH